MSEKISINKLVADGVVVQYLAPYAKMENSFLNVDELFTSKGNILHSARNVIKEVSQNNINLVIKSFRVPGLWGRMIYTWFRASKARRSFEYSLKLKASGIAVPQPVAFIECYAAGLLKNSYYLSEKFAYDCTVHEVLRNEMFSLEDVLPEVARFAYAMHQKGFMHLDFSPGNILLKKTPEGFLLSMVDVNRMSFGEIGLDDGLQGLVRLLRDKKGIDLLASAYAECAQQDKSIAVEKLTYLYQQYIKSSERLQKVKAPFKKLIGRS